MDLVQQVIIQYWSESIAKADVLSKQNRTAIFTNYLSDGGERSDPVFLGWRVDQEVHENCSL